MTALKEYARLEAEAIWRPDLEARRQEVTVSFGDASLVIADRSGRALTHWSLAAAVRMNGKETPALYTPSAEGTETLEIEDETMVAAIEKVRSAIQKSRPRRGRVRAVVLSLALLAAGAAAVVWLPDALIRHTLSVVPEPTRAEIGTGLFRAIGRVSGSPCRSVRGDAALAQLHARLVAPGKGGLLVLPAGIETTISLPGGLILLGRALVEDFETPDALAGFVLAEVERREGTDPLETLLRAAGPIETLRLLTTGHMPQATLDAHAETLVTEPRGEVPEADLLVRFATAKVASTPYAYALDVTGETTLSMIEADPMRGTGGTSVLADGAWVALQQICDS